MSLLIPPSPLYPSNFSEQPYQWAKQLCLILVLSCQNSSWFLQAVLHRGFRWITPDNIKMPQYSNSVSWDKAKILLIKERWWILQMVKWKAYCDNSWQFLHFKHQLPPSLIKRDSQGTVWRQFNVLANRCVGWAPLSSNISTLHTH